MAGKTGVTIRSAVTSETSAALGDHVVNVVLNCPEEQVTGTDAGRIVAAVEHPQAIWDRAVVDFPGDAVSEPHAGPLPSGPDDTVPLGQTVCRPGPATGGLLNLGPESNLYRLGERGCVARVRAVFAAADVNVAGPGRESRAALLTLAVDGAPLASGLAGVGTVDTLAVSDRGWLQGEGGVAVAASTLYGHREASLPGVTPPTVASGAGASCASIVPDRKAR